MKVKKIVIILAMLAAGGIGLFIFILYATVKTKSTDISTYSPFKEWVGKTVTLKKEMFLLEQDKNQIEEPVYPYLLIDSLHPQWQYAEAQKNNSNSDIKIIGKIPVGSKLSIEKAKQYTNGVSGFSQPALLGTLKNGEKEFKISFEWGDQNISKAMDGIEASWLFQQAPWQETKDTSYYILPQAKWW
ncbi:hypothetical protein [Sphingobacterium spiritivorum]|uniref:hypothetical protein n=1 Tax=Sphingobacterium spiritivorum TaxID=258 RepID=UPI001918E720|nr:hypothetical protein [Sphingobacterium spiritivorum]QQT27656.1 hypothetical protein I6J02_07380 [Sphingobacterium spiritivorum]